MAAPPEKKRRVSVTYVNGEEGETMRARKALAVVVREEEMAAIREKDREIERLCKEQNELLDDFESVAAIL